MAAAFCMGACVLWAASFIATKVALETVPPLTVVSLRLLVSALCFGAWFSFRGWPRGMLRPGRPRQLFILSLLGTGLHYGMQTVGLQWTTASNASIFAVTGPVSIAVIAILFLREKLTRRKAGGLALALAGVLVVMGLDTLSSFEIRSHLFGDFLVFSSIFLWALFTVYGKKLSAEMGALELSGAATLVGASWMAGAGILESWWTGFSLADVGPRAWSAIVFLGVTCSFLATALWFLALERTESQKAGIFLYTVPPITYLFAWLVLGEQPGFSLVAGSALVFFGVYLTETSR